MKSKLLKITTILMLIIAMCLNTNYVFADEDNSSSDTVPVVTEEPTPVTTPEPTVESTPEPTVEPTEEPTEKPTTEPTAEPTEEPTAEPTPDETEEIPSTTPTIKPSATPQSSAKPTATPTPSATPTPTPTPEEDEEEEENVNTYTGGDITLNTVVKSIVDKEDFSGKGVSLITVKGINKNDEYVDIDFTPKFDVNTYSYKCNVDLEVEKLEIDIELIDEEWNAEIVGNNKIDYGENLITILTSNEDKSENVTYQINVIKMDQNVQQVTTNDETDNSPKTASKDIILIVCLIIIFASIATIIVTKYLSYRKKTKNNRRDSDE